MQSDYAAAATLLACPHCGAARMEASGNDLVCGACAAKAPIVCKIPWLYADPEARLWEWRTLTTLKRRELEQDEDRIKEAQKAPGLTEAGQKRLRAYLQAKVEFRKSLDKLLEPLNAQAVGDLDVLRQLRGKVPMSQSLTGYIGNVYRDWGWPESTENDQALSLLRDAAAAVPAPKRMLVLGAGACRLPYDLHRTLGCETTLAVDINPFYLYLAQRMLGGRSLTLPEFPLAPDGAAHHAVTRRLEAPVPTPPGLHLVFADAMDPPFAPGAFDWVVVPWFIDIVPQDPRPLLAKLNRLIRPGGALVYFGSTVFQHSDPARCYSRDELLDMITGAGFAIARTDLSVIDYLASPSSCQSRREKVLTLAALKTGEAPAAAPFQPMPEWLLDPTIPIQPLPNFRDVGRVHAIYAGVIQLIDGRRSLRDLAASFSQAFKLAPEEAESTLRRFVAQLYEQPR
jgi:SAM-dependent methyltransferase